MLKPNKLDQAIVNLLLPRLKDELTAFYFYRAVSNWCKEVGYLKAGAFFHGESEDENGHAKGIENYLVDWNVIPNLPPLSVPELTFTSILDVIEKAYEIEYALYEAYEETSAEIFKLGDICTFDFLQTYRGIQTKSVAEYSDKLNILEGTNTDSKFEMLMLEETLFG